MPDKQYNVFLSFNKEDYQEVEQIAVYLKDHANLRPWFDQWELIPGEPWVRSLERGLAASETCAVFVGQSGEGPWQQREVETALRYQVNNREFRVIPVLLPDAPKQPELPMFLSGNMWVDFRGKRIDDDDGLWRLECGILWEAPGRGRPTKKQTAPKQETPKTPAIRLRSEPLTVSAEEFRTVFKLDEKWRPLEYIQNKYKDQGEVVVDHATGLMWQKSGSNEWLSYQESQQYIRQLNNERFAGYDDWRLPTVEELLSLVESEEQANKLYINPIFDAKQKWCWSADLVKSSSELAWHVSFLECLVNWDDCHYRYVRCVRSNKDVRQAGCDYKEKNERTENDPLLTETAITTGRDHFEQVKDQAIIITDTGTVNIHQHFRQQESEKPFEKKQQEKKHQEQETPLKSVYLHSNLVTTQALFPDKI
jgi:hypothetical protein